MIVGITDRSLYEDEAAYLSQIDRFLSSEGIDYLIVREPGLRGSEYRTLLKKIISRNPGCEDRLIAHRFIRIAAALGVRRVHLPEVLWGARLDDLELIYSVSLHEDSPKFHSIADEAEFFFISPVFDTTCKPGAKTIDPEWLRGQKDRYASKMVLLGGLDYDKIKALKKEGFEHFALRSGLDLLV